MPSNSESNSGCLGMQEMVEPTRIRALRWAITAAQSDGQPLHYSDAFHGIAGTDQLVTGH